MRCSQTTQKYYRALPKTGFDAKFVIKCRRNIYIPNHHLLLKRRDENNSAKNKETNKISLFKSLISSHYGIAKSFCRQQITQVPTKSQHLGQFQHLPIISVFCVLKLKLDDVSVSTLC